MWPRPYQRNWILSFSDLFIMKIISNRNLPSKTWTFHRPFILIDKDICLTKNKNYFSLFIETNLSWRLQLQQQTQKHQDQIQRIKEHQEQQLTDEINRAVMLQRMQQAARPAGSIGMVSRNNSKKKQKT